MNHDAAFNILLATVRHFVRYTPEEELHEWLVPASQRLAKFSKGVLAKHCWQLKKLQAAIKADAIIHKFVRELRLLGMEVPLPLRRGRVIKTELQYLYVVSVNHLHLEGSKVVYTYQVVCASDDVYYITHHVHTPKNVTIKYSRLPKKAKTLINKGLERVKK